MNERFTHSYVSPFTITHGDEMQGLLRISADFWGIACFLRDALEPVRIRVGIGVGALATDVRTDASIGMDGPVWHLAKNAIDHAHAERKFMLAATGDGNVDTVVNGIIGALARIRDDWTDRQKKIIDCGWPNVTQERIAEQLGVTQVNISKMVGRAKLDIYVDLCAALQCYLSDKYEFPRRYNQIRLYN